MRRERCVLVIQFDAEPQVSQEVLRNSILRILIDQALNFKLVPMEANAVPVSIGLDMPGADYLEVEMTPEQEDWCREVNTLKAAGRAREIERSKQ